MMNAVIVDIVRTASGRGKPGGALSGVHPVDLLATVLKALVDRSGIDPVLIDDVIAGCVTQAGDQAINVARTALLAAGFPESVPGTTVDRQCGSSQQAAHFAAQGVIAGAYDIAIACGVESMSRVPMFASVQGGHPQAPLHSRFPNLPGQGIGAELIASRWKFDREELDAFAAQSHRRAAAAAVAGGFANEIVPVALPDGSSHRTDETVRAATTAEGPAGLKPAFYTDEMALRYPEVNWNITPGNSSQITDGASWVILASEEAVKKHKLKPLARLVDSEWSALDPAIMGLGPTLSSTVLMKRHGLSREDIGLWELNEAFGAQVLGCLAAWEDDTYSREVLGLETAFGAIDRNKLNVDGGAISLGHPVGTSGNRIVLHLVNAMRRLGETRGIATECIGGGLGGAMLIEVV